MAASKSTTAKKPAAKKVKAAATSKATAKTVSSKTLSSIIGDSGKVTTKTKTATAGEPATTVKKTAAAKKPAARAKDAPSKVIAPTPEQRYKMVQEAAYFIAERNGFASGSMDYWIAAEAEIEALLSSKK